MNAKENLLRAIRHDEPGWVPRAGEAIVQLCPPIVERPKDSGADDFGVRWSLEEGAEGGTYPAPGGHTIADVGAGVRGITIPDPDAYDWSRLEAEAKEIDRGRFLVQGFVEMGLFERSYLLLGMEEALMAYVTEPDAMREILEAIADYKIAFIRRFHEAAKPDLVWYGDDWGTQRNTFLPPEVWRRVVRPPTQRIYDCMKERGILVNQHSCGKVEPLIGDIIEMGAAIWNPCQPCNDLSALKRRYAGRITFCGALDSQFVLNRPGVTPDEVRLEVRRRIDELAEGGGYIAGPSHHVPYDPEIVEAMNDEIDTYGRTFYARA